MNRSESRRACGYVDVAVSVGHLRQRPDIADGQRVDAGTGFVDVVAEKGPEDESVGKENVRDEGHDSARDGEKLEDGRTSSVLFCPGKREQPQRSNSCNEFWAQRDVAEKDSVVVIAVYGQKRQTEDNDRHDAVLQCSG